MHVRNRGELGNLMDVVLRTSIAKSVNNGKGVGLAILYIFVMHALPQ